MPTTDAPRKPRGGKRPGAGAPRGNTNALSTGARSRRLAPLHRALDANGRTILTHALTRATADALAHAPRDGTPAATAARRNARERAVRHVLGRLAAIDWSAHARPAAQRRAFIAALIPIALGRDRVPPPANTAQTTTQSTRPSDPRSSDSPSPRPGRPGERGPGGEGTPLTG